MAPTDQPADLRPLRVLLVDDDRDDYLLTRELFADMKDRRYTLDWETDADAGLAAICRAEHDVYLLDYQLGRRNGLDVLRDALAKQCTGPVIILTGQGERDIDLAAMQAGAADFLEKGRLDAAMLERSIRYALAHKRHRDELLAAQDRLRLADRMATVGTLAAGLAHDINNVTFPLAARLSMLLKGPALDEDTHDHLLAVQGLLNHLRDMSKNLSLFSRDPRQEGTTGQTELVDWCNKAWKLIEVSMRGVPGGTAHSIRLECDIPAGLPLVAIAPHRLTQAVFNLVQNARDAIQARKGFPAAADGKDGKYTGHIRIQARPDGDSGMVNIQVSDDGVGMDEQTRLRCIEPFFTTKDRPSNPGEGGSGMGMSVVHAIAERTGGRLEIESAPGRGTSVSLTLPTASATAVNAAAKPNPGTPLTPASTDDRAGARV